MTLGLSLSAPSGTLQQAFSQVKQAHDERCATLPTGAEHEPKTVQSTDPEVGSNSKNILTPLETVVPATCTTYPVVSPTSAATSLSPPSTGRVSPQTISNQSTDPASDPSPPLQSSHETAPSQLPPVAIIPPPLTISPPFTQTPVPAVPALQVSNGSVPGSSVGVTSSSVGTLPASDQQPFNTAAPSSQPIISSIHAPQSTTSQTQPIPISTQSPPPASLPSQSQVQPQPVESEGAELQNKAAGRDDIETLDKKLRSLFKDPSSSSASVDPSPTIGTSSPPTGTSSPPPGVALVPPSNLPLTSGVQGVLGPTTTPGQVVTPGGHAQTPPSKPRAQVSERCWIRQQIHNPINRQIMVPVCYILFLDFTFGSWTNLNTKLWACAPISWTKSGEVYCALQHYLHILVLLDCFS